MDNHGNPYWNGVARSGSHAPGTGKVHRARIENGRIVEIECGQRAETWVAFTDDSTPQRDRRTCSKCGQVWRVPGVERADHWSWVNLTDAYSPADWAPKPATDGGLISSESLGPADGEAYNPETYLPEWMEGTATMADGRGLYILTVSGRCSCGNSDWGIAPDWKVPAENGGGYMTSDCPACLGTMEYTEGWQRVDHLVSEWSELNPRSDDTEGEQ